MTKEKNSAYRKRQDGQTSAGAGGDGGEEPVMTKVDLEMEWLNYLDRVLQCAILALKEVITMTEEKKSAYRKRVPSMSTSDKNNSGIIGSQLVGRRIVAVDLRPFNDGRGGTTTAPLLKLDDGTSIWFSVHETETDSYGIVMHSMNGYQA